MRWRVASLAGRRWSISRLMLTAPIVATGAIIDATRRFPLDSQDAWLGETTMAPPPPALSQRRVLGDLGAPLGTHPRL